MQRLLACSTGRPPRRLLPLLPLLAAALLLALPARAHAQCRTLENGEVWCDDGSGPGGDNFPYADITPASLRTTQPVVPVTIRMRDDKGLVDSTFRVRVNGVDTTASFSYSKTVSGTGPMPVQAVATGLVRLSGTGPTTVEARICDNAPERQCVTNADPVVYVLSLPRVVLTPDGESTAVAAGARTRTFEVRNAGTETATFHFSADCRNAQTGTAAGACTSPGPVTLGPGVSASVPVGFTAVAGQSLAIGLTARQADAPGVHDTGWMNAVVRGAAGTAHVAPLIQEVDLNSGAAGILRSQCVTVSAGPGAAYECGDLRLAHALPAHRTLSRTWAPVLLYNSQHADPRPTIYYDVTLPEGSVVPPEMVAVLYLNDTGQTVQVVFPGSEWQPGTTRRIAVQFDGASRGSGRYGYHFQVLARGPGWQVSSRVADSSFDIVNRLFSPFGSGWWLAGLESLCICFPGGATLLWTGGDGSTLRFDPAPAGNTWLAARRDGPPDTLRWVNGTHYVRTVRGGGEIHFDGSGRHLRTVNRLGQTTRFTWQNHRLARIDVPVPGTGAGPGYDFVYDAYDVLARVDATSPAAATRSVLLPREPGGGSRVMSIQDPDGRTVWFGYDLPARVFVATRRTDRRGTPLRFTFSPSGRLVATHLPLAPDDTIINRFTPVEDRGVGASVALGAAYTLLDGPRTDVPDRTWIWHGQQAAPRHVRDALGGETVITRGDARFPALATEVVGPSGLRTTAVYDARGRVSESIVHNPLGDGRNARTRYAYDDRWDAPTEVRTEGVDASGAATPLAGTAYTTYDAIGNALTRRQGLDDTHQVRFTYYPAGHPHAGLPASVTGAQDAAGRRGRDSLVYDAQGNLARTISPAGFLTLHYRDGLGRDTLVITPTDEAPATTEAGLIASGARMRTAYDVMDRPWRTESVGPARTYAAVNPGFAPAPTPQERLEVVTTFDPEGAPETVHRTATPDYDNGSGFVTSYTYDAAGRRKSETSSQSGTQTFTLDHAGNVVATHTAAGHTVTLRYDALGRLTRRMVPQRTYARTCDEIILVIDGCIPFPRFPNFGTGYRVAEEWHHYRYDAAGNQVYAENADARVQRTHFPNGAVQTDSSWIRAAEDVTYSAFGLRYTYDLAGRVTSLEHPRNLTGGSVRPDSFSYHPVTGALSRATSRLSHAFDFHHAPNGALTSLRQPGSIVDSLRYDVEGRLVWRTESGPAAGVLHDETMTYDARGKLLHADNGASGFHNWYSSLGVLVGTDWYNLTQNVGRIAEELRTDPLGNTALRRTSLERDASGEFGRFENYYQPSTGRLIYSRRLPPPGVSSNFVQDSTIRRYDAGGNVIRGYQRVGQAVDGGVQIGQEVESRSYYGADDRLRVMQKLDVRRTDWSNHQNAGVWEEYRYDALGRRVLVNTRTDGGLCDYDAWACTPSATTFVWAGDQLLWELKSASGAAGGNVGYFHAGGIDRPLVITKGSTSIVPHQNWRGQFARGTYADGANVGQRSDCTSYPASGCVPIQWPGERTTARHELDPQGEIRNWFGSLVDDMRDASGQMYRRNRYYDPQTGQFTQPDPIGIAGGLNAYGFAEGDPVSYSDPYGLEAEEIGEQCRGRLSCAIRGIRAAQSAYRTWRATRRARGAVDDLVDAASRSGRAAQRLDPPATPDGMSLSNFGSNVMRWGRGNAEARDRIGSLTREELEQAGVTRQMVREWRDFYVNEVVRNPNNPSARGRAELMQHATELLP